MDPRCPLKRPTLPTAACPEGRKAVTLAKKAQHGGCPWFVADAESNFCFFKHLADHGHPLTTRQIARMLMIDDNEVKRVLQNFRRKTGADQMKDPEDLFD